MYPGRATAISCPNIAFIKYWGDRDETLHLPSSGSISMNLEGLFTRTRVAYDPSLTQDQLTINGEAAQPVAQARASALLGRVRRTSGLQHFAHVTSTNNFPMGAGIASSASAFAALALAASAAAGLELDETALSRLARFGSGSACRSVPAGFVEWQAGTDDSSSYAFSIAPPDHWSLADCIAIVDQEHKSTGSQEGHTLASSSPLQAARLAGASSRLERCRRAILACDFDALAQVAELDSNLMHAVMMTSTPPLLYWQPATLTVMQAVQSWRAHGIPVFYTIDAGPNVHVLCPAAQVDRLNNLLAALPGVRSVLSARPGGPTHLESEPISSQIS
jgi:diphosphomevalonate decarboxylase